MNIFSSNILLSVALTAGFLAPCSTGHAHLIGDAQHDEMTRRIAREFRPVQVALLAQTAKASAPASLDAAAPAAAAIFARFAPAVRERWDENFLYIESDGMPAHRLMVGITAWQQQVPIPQPYVGDNAWRIPLHPVPAAQPLSAKTHFFRGAIAIAANGVPIFNPIKNDGRTDTFLAGELDEFGGHSGRADDYHYHTAPLHLQKILGAGLPVAYALDGYAIYGLTEPDGAAVTGLDAFNGHTTPALGYHYHGSKTYPYLNGGFHGEVVERDGQVDPQPRARGVREATEPLRGAVITGFSSPRPDAYSLEYRVGTETRRVNYARVADGVWKFEFVDGGGSARTETYAGRAAGGGGGEPPRDGKKKRDAAPPPKEGVPARQPWMKVHALEMDANHDGTLTRDELAAEVERVFSGYDRNHDGKLTRDEYADGPGVRSAMGGFVKQHAEEIDGDHDGVITKAELMANATRMFDRTDANHDGKLSPEETALPPGYKATPPEAPVRREK